jgi:hypothetical protein
VPAKGTSIVKGRARTARPLVCAFVVIFSALGVTAASAGAHVPAPVLKGTSPASPSTETRPRVLGASEEGGVISVVERRTPFGMPVTRATKNPDFQIKVYADACHDADAVLVGEGSAAELEADGIQVSQDLPLDTRTILFATQTDPGTKEESVCSNSIVYQQVTSNTSEPVFTSTEPPSPADDNTPKLIGTAPTGSAISIFVDPECAGPPVAIGLASKFEAEGIEVNVGDNTTTTFYLEDTLAGLPSGCSTSSIEYQEVTRETPPVEEPPHEEPPHEEHPGGGGPPAEERPNPPGKPAAPKLRTTPEGAANDNTPSVTGKAPGAARVLVFAGEHCTGGALADGTIAQLGAGLPIQVADNTSVSLFGVSVDAGGDRSPCSSSPVVYVEDSTPPHSRITSGPGSKTHKRTVRFTFGDTTGDSSVGFRCRVDRKAWKACSSPLKLRHLGHRRHKLTVKGIDAAGNSEAKGATRAFRVIGRR